MANTPQAEFYALGQSIVKTRPLEFYYVATFREEEVPNTHWDKVAVAGDRQSKTATMKSDVRLALVYFAGVDRTAMPLTHMAFYLRRKLLKDIFQRRPPSTQPLSHSPTWCCFASSQPIPRTRADL